MSGSRAAVRYAKAALSFSLEQNKEVEVNNDMLLIVKTIDENKDLQLLLNSPILKSEIKNAVLIIVGNGDGEYFDQVYNTCMNNKRISKKDIENDLIRIFEKYPKSLEKAISICFNLVLDCFVVIYGEKKTIKLLEEAKKSIRSGKHTQKQRQTRKTTKRSQK